MHSVDENIKIYKQKRVYLLHILKCQHNLNSKNINFRHIQVNMNYYLNDWTNYF